MKKHTYEDVVKFVLSKIEDSKMWNGNISWGKVADLTKKEFPNEYVTKEKVRGIYRRNTDPKFVETARKTNEMAKMRSRGIREIREVVLSKIKNKVSVEYLQEILPYSYEEILAEIAKLELEGYSINKWVENGVQFAQIEKRKYRNKKVRKIEVDDEIKIMIFSDTHIGHRQSKIEEMQSFIKYGYEQGVRMALFAGDLVEGHYMSIRPTSIKELDAIGFDEQLQLANEVLPKYDGLTYYMISANHDGSFDRNAFANPVKTLSLIRDDVEYLGHNFGKIELTPKTDISMIHPDDGIGQNYSLKMRQHIDRANRNKQARLVFMGHYHKFDHTHYKGVDGWIMPSFVGQSNFMDTKNLESIVGGIILTLKFDKSGEIISLLPEYLFFD